jgi:hypothetical protein
MVHWCWTRVTDFFLLRRVRFESTIHCNVVPQLGGSSWVTSLICLFMDIRYVDLAFITPQAKGMAFVRLNLSVWPSLSDTQLVFPNISKGGRYYISGKIRFFQNYCRTIHPMFLITSFSENDNFVRETKIVLQERITVTVKRAPRKVTILQMRGQPCG